MLYFNLAFVEIQKVIDEVALSVLEENLENICFCDIEKEMVKSFIIFLFAVRVQKNIPGLAH